MYMEEYRDNLEAEERGMHRRPNRVPLSEELVDSPTVERAKQLIEEFWDASGMRGVQTDEGIASGFRTPTNVLLAYWEYNDRWPRRPVSVLADLIRYRIWTMVDEMYLLREDWYEDLEHMTDEALSHLDFDELVHVSEAEFGLIENTSAKLKYLAYEKDDMPAWRRLLFSTFPIVRKHKRNRGDLNAEKSNPAR